MPEFFPFAKWFKAKQTTPAKVMKVILSVWFLHMWLSSFTQIPATLRNSTQKSHKRLQKDSYPS